MKVVIGVIQNIKQEILIAQRAQHLHQGGKWEFPGGKVLSHETSRYALTRELHEELDIDVQRAVPLIRIHYDYSDRHVTLDVWRVLEFSREAHGKEGQPIRWVMRNELEQYDFPAANQFIINAIRLPHFYPITSALTANALHQQVTHFLANGHRLIRFRAQGWEQSEYLRLIPIIIELCASYKAELMIDGEPELLERFAARGLHLTSAKLAQYTQRPITKKYWLGVSCHTLEELQHAKKVDADFALVSPVLPTPSHLEVNPLGWPMFAKLVDSVNFPVYALGGMTLQQPAIWFGAQGMAGIKMFSPSLQR